MGIEFGTYTDWFFIFPIIALIHAGQCNVCEQGFGWGIELAIANGYMIIWFPSLKIKNKKEPVFA